MKIKYEPTIQLVRDMASRLRASAKELDMVCDNIRNSKDPAACAEALTVITNLHINLRLDLLVTKSCRAYKETYEKDIMDTKSTVL